MIANYHTHTARCGHARGQEREYVENAIAGGLKILGFSDHTPYPFPEDYKPRTRMAVSQFEDYVDTVLALKKEYAGQIEIHLGVEAEYYPKYFDALLKLMRDYPVEYMIYAQHFLDNEIGETFCGNYKEDTAYLDRYCAQVIAGMETGVFTYFAHPDLIRDMGQPALYEDRMREVCRVANRCHLPVEINLLGVRDNRHYPNELFWKVAGEEGCRVILGSDAHEPESVYRTEDIEKAMMLVKKYHLNLIDTVALKKP